MLRTIRLTLAIVFFALVTLLFLDFTETLHGWMGWMAKIQFLPALLALNVGVVLLLVVLTLLFGRVYCSVICPLGVFQDIISRFAGKRKKNRFRYSPAKKWLRYGMLALFAVTLIAGVRFHAVASLLEPYSSYGRIASNLFAPVYQWGNNLLAYLAERADSYAFYETEVWMKSLPTFIIASLTFAVLIILAWRGGRTYCNTICPVGTVLGFLSKYSFFKPVIYGGRNQTDQQRGTGLRHGGTSYIDLVSIVFAGIVGSCHHDTCRSMQIASRKRYGRYRHQDRPDIDTDTICCKHPCCDFCKHIALDTAVVADCNRRFFKVFLQIVC